MRIGTGRVDITPPVGILMGGQLGDILASGVESPLFATAMAVEEGETEALWIACDLLMLTNEMARFLRGQISQRAGVPTTNVVVSATHTHSGPLTVPVFGMNADVEYAARLPALIVAAAMEAHHNLK